MLQPNFNGSILMAQCNAVKRSAHGASPLKILFYKLCKFLRLPGTFVFVFDGKERPKLKNGRYVPCNEEPSWYGPCQTMIKAFGFFVHIVYASYLYLYVYVLKYLSRHQARVRPS